MPDIKRLLNKKGWTGRELGIILLTNAAHIYKQALDGIDEPTPFVSDTQFMKMVNDLTDKTQGKTYNEYYRIYEWLRTRPALTNGYYFNATHHFSVLRNYITHALFGEEVFRYVEQLPAIMTQKQYDEIREKRLEEVFKDEDGEELMISTFNLIEEYISYYLHKLEKEPGKPNPLKAIRKKYVSEPVKSDLILSRWNEITGDGYYTLEDGRRSDEMTREEWQAAITTPAMREALEHMGIDGDSNNALAISIAAKRIEDRAKVIFNGGTEEDADKAQGEADYKAGLAVPCEWHYYEEAPDDLTKWDVIENEYLLELYPADLDGSGDEYSEDNFTRSMEDFKSEFSELIAVALKEMQEKYFKESGLNLPALPVKKWGEGLVSERTLYEADFYGARERLLSDTSIFEGNQRAIFNGIAILRPSDLLNDSPRIDERGYYLEPTIKHTMSDFSLEAFFPEAEEYAENVHAVAEARYGLLANYFHLVGYNKQIDLVIALTDIPELEVFKQPVEEIEAKIDALNGLVPILYSHIKSTDYQDKELQERKMEVLQDVFPEIPYKKLSIPEENLREAEALVNSHKAFTESHMLFDSLLCTLPELDGEGGY